MKGIRESVGAAEFMARTAIDIKNIAMKEGTDIEAWYDLGRGDWSNDEGCVSPIPHFHQASYHPVSLMRCQSRCIASGKMTSCESLLSGVASNRPRHFVRLPAMRPMFRTQVVLDFMNICRCLSALEFSLLLLVPCSCDSLQGAPPQLNSLLPALQPLRVTLQIGTMLEWPLVSNCETCHGSSGSIRCHGLRNACDICSILMLMRVRSSHLDGCEPLSQEA